MIGKRSSVIEGLDLDEMHRTDMQSISEPVLKTTDEPGARNQLEMHSLHHPHDHAHVDLSKDEYIPEEVARMLGTSLDVVMHAIWSGELKAERMGQNVVCIPHAALTAWLINRCRGG